MVTNPGDVELTENNIKTAFDTDNNCMHVLFKIDANEEYCAIASNILEENQYVDLSKMTSLSIKVKGSGFIRIYFATKYIKTNYSWGHLGAVIELTSAWKTVSITTANLIPAEWSDAETDGVTWNDCKAEAGAFAIEAAANSAGDKVDAEFYVDDIIFKGMKYSDIITPVRILFGHSQANKAGSRFSVTNNALTYTIAQPQKVFFTIIDLQGNVVAQLNGNNTAGTHSIVLPTTLSAGNYLLRMKDASTSQQFSILK